MMAYSATNDCPSGGVLSCHMASNTPYNSTLDAALGLHGAARGQNKNGQSEKNGKGAHG
jgi:hypothetical protein